MFSRSRIPLRGIEHRAVAARDGRERVLVHRREVVILGERVDGEFPVDRAVQHLFTQRRPSSDTPGFQFVGERPEERRDVEGSAVVQRNPQEAGTFGGRHLRQFRRAGTCFGKAFLTGHAHEVAVQVVGPRVVRTSQPAGGSAVVGDA
jgi:hypothetical protein